MGSTWMGGGRATHCVGRALSSSVLLVAACGGQAPPAETFEVQDSAGVRIVTSVAPAWHEGEEWRLGPDPALVLGGSGAPEEEQLWQVAGLARAPDGRLVVSLAGASEVRVYSGNGERLVTLGGAGQGPGEFERAFAVAVVPPDTILAFDRLRMHTFLADGSLVTTSPFPAPNALGSGTGLQPVFPLPDRSMLALVGRFRGGGSPVGLYRPDQGTALIPAGGAAPILLGWYLGIEQEYKGEGDRRLSVVPPFARFSAVAAGGMADPRYATGDNAVYSIDIFDGSGALRQVVRRALPEIPVRAEWIEAWKDQQRNASWTQGQLPELERAWASMAVPETLPWFEALHIDDLGYLWVQRNLGTLSGDLTYDVFTPDGVFGGTVLVPAGLWPLPQPVITEDAFIGVWADELEVESVRVFPLERH
ncbi:MAG: hypothetical protein R3E10_19490 [Gemmatimonadota bacterium]